MTVLVILKYWLQAKHQSDSPRDHREVPRQLDFSLGMSGLPTDVAVFCRSAHLIGRRSKLEILPIAQGLAGHYTTLYSRPRTFQRSISEVLPA